jgi:hypothetical protein
VEDGVHVIVAFPSLTDAPTDDDFHEDPDRYCTTARVPSLTDVTTAAVVAVPAVTLDFAVTTTAREITSTVNSLVVSEPTETLYVRVDEGRQVSVTLPLAGIVDRTDEARKSPSVSYSTTATWPAVPVVVTDASSP